MKRAIPVIACMIALSSPGSDTRAEDPNPEQIIDKAIRAHGGEDKLMGLSGFSYKTRTVFEKGPTWSYDYVVEPPLRYRYGIRTGTGDKAVSHVVIDGNQGWLKSDGGETTAYPPAFVDSFKKYTIPYLGPRSILRLRYRQKNPNCHISTVGECTIDGHQAMGVRMKLQDGPQETWYFDKETGLLLKEESSVKRFEGDETASTMTYGDYKTFDGFPMACKVAIHQDGKLTSTRELLEFKVGTPDPSSFAKP